MISLTRNSRLMRVASTSIKMRRPFISLISDIFNPGRFSASETVTIAKSIFYSCKENGQRSQWAQNYGVRNDYRSKHGLILMHVWVVHKRLIKEGRDGKRIQEALFDLLWDDTSARLRAIDVPEISINNYLMQVQSYSLQTCTNLDSVIHKIQENGLKMEAEEDVNLIMDELNDIFSLYFWQKSEESVKDGHAFKLAKYFFNEFRSTQSATFDSIIRGNINWSLIEGQVLDLSEKRRKEANPHGEWREALADNGKIYYWNTKTRETSWTKQA
jgi:cytochrome b pre-mRNA-processing protein 3